MEYGNGSREKKMSKGERERNTWMGTERGGKKRKEGQKEEGKKDD